MTMMTMLLAVSIAAPGTETWVVVSRRTGTTSPKSLEVASVVAKALTNAGVPSTIAPEDLSTCAGKKPCLVEKGKAKGVPAMVLLDVGAVLGEGVGKLEVVSVDEFGKKIVSVDAEGKADEIGGALVAKVPVLVKPLKELLGIKDAPAIVTKVEEPKKDPVKTEAVKTEPAKVVVASPDLPPPPPPPALEVKDEGPGFFTTPRIVGLSAVGAGIGAAVVGGVFLSQAASASRTIDELCPMRAGCNNAEAYNAWTRAAPSQNLGVVLMVSGGLIAASGAIFLLLNPGAPAEPTPAVSVVPTAGGASASVTFPLP
jgi:hypothetical protein